MGNYSLEKLELNKILSAVSEYAATKGGKEDILACCPSDDLGEVRRRLSLTFECDKLLYKYGIGKIESFVSVNEAAVRAKKGSTLSCAELLDCAAVLRSARCAFESIDKVVDDEITLIRAYSNRLYYDKFTEEDIFDKIISVDSVSDHASERLYTIRSKIKQLNERIRERLSEYVTGKDGEYLQDGIVTIRNDRYVIPVKAEHKSHVKGFVHDRSKTGATFFIEPEYILELNNELIALQIDEREEVEAVLKALSVRVGSMSENVAEDEIILAELDGMFARAEYSYAHKCTMPSVNDRGIIRIIKGRHPLIDKNKVVPVSVELGERYNFLLLSGANTGGKTVTMKTVGLFCAMAACGLYIPACEGSQIAVFKNVFCDIGDSQSIEESLSTFSSHMTNIAYICNNADNKSLVIIDELGGGTNPDEGQALAKAVVKYLLDCGAKGIVTTHFTPLKEFAYTVKGIENASMEFDSDTLKPLYRLKTGLPGASNALIIARRLGLNGEILKQAESYLSDGARDFENILRRAEDSRIKAEEKLSEALALEKNWREKVNSVNAKIEEINREKEKIAKSARSESRRIISERTEQAESILAEIEDIFKKAEVSQKDLIAARTLKNKLVNSAYEEEESKKKIEEFVPATPKNIKNGVNVYVKRMDCRGIITDYSENKDEAEVTCGSLKMHIKLKDLSVCLNDEKVPVNKVKIVKSLPKDRPILEINVLGLTVIEALYEVDNFIDKALIDNLDEIKVIHGVGTGKLKNAIAEHLKKHKRVESFRSGKYGEGETGVTFIKLK